MLSALPPMALAALGVALLSGMDAVIKHLSATNSLLAITFGRYVFGAAAAGAIWLGSGRPRITLEMLRAHALRSVLIVVVALTFFFALRVLPLAEAIALSFVAPVLVPFFAWGVVGERPRPANIAACLAGFAGAFIATWTPAGVERGALYFEGVAAALVASAAYAWSIALLRSRADRDGPAAVGLLQTLLPALIVAAPAVAFAKPPSLVDAPLFLLMGTLGATGWYFLINAYGRAEAQKLAPLDFTGLMWAGAFGFFFFDETPRPQVYAGAALIVGACLYVVWRERNDARAQPLAPVS